jgi:cell division protease FtsH
VSFYDPTQENQFTKPYSEETGKLIDDEVRALIDKAYERTKSLLRVKRKEVEDLAHALLDKEVLHQNDVEEIIGKRPFEDKKVLLDEPSAKVTAPTNGEISNTTEAGADKVNL